MRYTWILTIIMLVFTACRPQENKEVPAGFYGTDLFRDVQLRALFPDSKTFADCVPRRPIDQILDEYTKQHTAPDFDLQAFVTANFALPQRPQSTFMTDTLVSMEQHITNLWATLTRQPDRYDPGSSLIDLPNAYVVPGGRFSEVYYWDSYFTMVGLNVQGRLDLMRGMVSNFAYLIDTLGFIPNGNRNYYLTRSQPPFFSLMVELLASKEPKALEQYLPQLQKEYAFWMRGTDKLRAPGDAAEHTVRMPDGAVLNRYFDSGELPRPEAFKEDVTIAQQAGGEPELGREPAVVYNALRSAAESGWDFSSRWLGDGKSLATVHTADLVPIDLNALIFHLERMIARGLAQTGDSTAAAAYERKAAERRKAILANCWDPETGFFYDYNVKTNTRSTVKSLAGVYPLFFSLATAEQSNSVAAVLEREFLKPGGLTTTLTVTGQQWDAPNGWAPLQWLAYVGLKNYGHTQLAGEIRHRWLRQNMRVYQATGKMMEKYNVMDTTLVAGGGEYPNQDGFGWTNGVALALLAERP